MFAMFREDELVKRARKLKISAGIEPDTDLGPVITKQVQHLDV